QGTEILDNMAPSFVSAPPDALRTYLGIDKWSFRDSNWSPDFAISAQKIPPAKIAEKNNKKMKSNLRIYFKFFFWRKH
ncbi:MAG TPA: hypothetical protein VJB62_04365, partial [Patescibacteria group bacterium]|nr:hypothetical protein [Patescibacteria group bacterium]